MRLLTCHLKNIPLPLVLTLLQYYHQSTARRKTTITSSSLFATATIASPHLFSEDQPLSLKCGGGDGREGGGFPTGLQRIIGSPANHYTQTSEGYTTMKNSDGCIVYATLDEESGLLKPTEHLVGLMEVNGTDDEMESLGLVKGVKVEETVMKEECQKRDFCRYMMNREKRGGRRKDLEKRRGLRGGRDKIIMKENDGVEKDDRRTSVSGVKNNLVVLLRFSDHIDRVLPQPEKIDILFNEDHSEDDDEENPTNTTSEEEEDVARTGSIYDVFNANSYGTLSILSTVVTPNWITISKTEAECSDKSSGTTEILHECIKEALEILDSNTTPVSFDAFDHDNDGQVDLMTVLHSGFGAEWGGQDDRGTYHEDRIWSHQWAFDTPFVSTQKSSTSVEIREYAIASSLWNRSGSKIARIGTIAHEIGLHFLPPMYDTDGFGGFGMGCYDLMSHSWGCDGSQLIPPPLSAYSKYQLGWLEPKVIPDGGNRGDEYQVEPGVLEPVAYMIERGYGEGEYLLIENRQKVEGSYDEKLHDSGLAIWHVDEKASHNDEGYPQQTPKPPNTQNWPENGHHYRVALLQADGQYDLEKGMNTGDSNDLFNSEDEFDGIGPDGVFFSSTQETRYDYPNTDSYQGGVTQATGIRIFDIGYKYPTQVPQKLTMKFRLEVDESINGESTPVDPVDDNTVPPSFGDGGGENEFTRSDCLERGNVCDPFVDQCCHGYVIMEPAVTSCFCV